MKNNKRALVYIVLAAVSALLYIVNIAAPERTAPLLDLSFLLITAAGIWIVYSAGTLRRSKLRWGVIAGCIFLIAAGLLHMFHGPHGNVVFYAGLGLVTLFYLIHFITKPVKTFIDWLKLAWVIIRAAGAALVYNEISYGNIFVYTADILLLGLIFLFIYRNHHLDITAKRREL